MRSQIYMDLTILITQWLPVLNTCEMFLNKAIAKMGWISSSAHSRPYVGIQSTLVVGFSIVQTWGHTHGLPRRQWKRWAYRVLAQWVMKRREKCVRAQVLRCLREKSVHSMGSKRVREKAGKVKKHRMNLSLQYTEEMKQSILCSWTEPVDDDEPLQNFPAGHSTAALFIPVPKPSRLQPIILWQPASTLLTAHSRLRYTRLERSYRRCSRSVLF